MGLGQTRPTILKHPPIVLTYNIAECDWLQALMGHSAEGQTFKMLA